MSYTMEDFERDYFEEHFSKLSPDEQEKMLHALPPEKRLSGLSEKQIRQYLDRLTASRPSGPRRSRRKK
jgi:hypothetical protein